MKLGWRVALIILGLLALYAAVWRLLWNQEHPWARYGVVLEGDGGIMTSKAVPSLIRFKIARDGQVIAGPLIIGNHLFVTYRYRDRVQTPDAIIQSKDHSDWNVVLSLNLSDSSQPEFEILKVNGLAISYPPRGYKVNLGAWLEDNIKARAHGQLPSQ